MNRLASVLLLLFFWCPYLLQAQEKSLDDFLQQGKANSPLLNNFSIQAKVIGLDSARIRAGYGFQVSAEGNLTYAPIIHGWGYDPAITNGQNVSGLMVVNREIISRKQLQTRLNSYSIQQKSVQGQSRLSEQSLAQQITQQYIVCYGDQQQLLLSDEILSFLQKEDIILQALARGSVLKQTDYLAFKVELQQQNLTREQIRIQLLNDLAVLNYICGIEDTSLITLTSPDIRSSFVPSFDQSVYADNFRVDSLKNANDEELIRLNYKPHLNAFADGGYQSAIPGQAYKNVGVSAGIRVSLPIYDGKQREIALSQNRLAEDSRKKYRDFAEQQFGQQTKQWIQQLNEYRSLITSANQQMEYAQTLMEANRKQLSSGDVHMTDYLLSVHNRLNLGFALIQYKATELTIVNELNYLILK